MEVVFDAEDNIVGEVPEYPAVFEQYSETEVVVTFPDWDYGVTSGEDEADALLWAQDLLYSILWYAVQDGEAIPDPSPCAPGERLVKAIPMVDGMESHGVVAMQ